MPINVQDFILPEIPIRESAGLKNMADQMRYNQEVEYRRQKEAEKRDHRKLGKELSLFTFDDDVGPGLQLWLPNGTVIIEELEKLAKETEFKMGYVRVRTPHLAKESMYKIILNSSYGAMKSKWNKLYNPEMANNIVVNGQLIMTHLICLLDGHCELIQTNTDGIIIKYEKGFENY